MSNCSQSDQPLEQDSNRRRYVRIRYPSTGRPRLSIGNARFAVAEISERGLRIRGGEIASDNGIVRGLLHLGDGKSIPVEGSVARRDGREIVLVDIKGIRSLDIVNEQRWIMKNYPNFTPQMVPFPQGDK